MSKHISHIGKVTAVGGGGISVLIDRKEACSHCDAKKSCTAMTATDQTMKFKVKDYQDFTVGEQVRVSINTSLGMRAVLLAYVLPLLVLMLSLVIGFQCFASELVQVAFALIPTVFYYVILYRFRHKIEQNFTFTVSKL